MGAFIARQPNGLLCRWSSIVDNITHFNMTEEEYIEIRAEWEREQARIDMKNPYFIRPFSEILSKRDEDLIFQSIGVIENKEDYTHEEVEIAKDEIKRLQSEFDEYVKIMSEPFNEDSSKNRKTKESTYFIAKCGGKYLYEWSEIQSSYYVWFDYPSKFKTKEECLKAVASTMGQSGKPESHIIIQEVKETVITEVVSEELDVKL